MMQLNKSNVQKLPKYAGIYKITNTLNNKAYIGQSIRLRKRIYTHIFNAEKNNINNSLYQAINKYGIENFTIEILETFKNLNKEVLINTLDEKEKYYINKYNTYGITGYNQTKGGDAGILGYKMTSSQKEHISKNSENSANDGRNKIYCYNTIDKSTIVMVSLKKLSELLHIKLWTGDIKNLLIRNKYILARTEKILKDKITLFALKYNDLYSK